jgi:hypothetical protein
MRKPEKRSDRCSERVMKSEFFLFDAIATFYLLVAIFEEDLVIGATIIPDVCFKLLNARPQGQECTFMDLWHS